MLKRTCNFFQHAFQEVLLLALLHLLCSDRILEGQDVVAEPQLLPDRQCGESSLQGDLRRVKHIVTILFNVLKKQLSIHFPTTSSTVFPGASCGSLLVKQMDDHSTENTGSEFDLW